jgi:hypothetical protein
MSQASETAVNGEGGQDKYQNVNQSPYKGDPCGHPEIPGLIHAPEPSHMSVIVGHKCNCREN